MRHYLIAILLMFAASKAMAAADMYCVKETAKCSYGTPSTSKLSLVDRAKALYKMTIEKYNETVTNKTFEAKTSNELIVLAKALIASQTCNPATHTGTWPNCVLIPPKVCEPPKTGTYPNCGQCTEPNEGIYPACKPKVCIAPKVGTYPDCKDPVVPPVDYIWKKELMPDVDTRYFVTPAVGYSDLRVYDTSEQPKPNAEGAFRISCGVSHMSFDDPMVYPGLKDWTHHHTFYGNTTIKYDTDLSKIAFIGNSTCNGGTMNRSAYWHPTIIDSLTNKPVIMTSVIFYYKIGFALPKNVKTPPAGLRMLAGNPQGKNANESVGTKFVCLNNATQNSNGMPWQKTLPNCGLGHTMQMVITFPQCWDGKNLDSPNHRDHMAYPVAWQSENACPATHPVNLPEISLNVNHNVAFTNQMAKWRLASDNYTFNGSNAGFSGHADWVNGWDQPTLDGVVKNCLVAFKDCHAHLLGNGKMFK
jgi:hypothetical protein